MPFDPHMHTDSEYRLLQNELQQANLTIAALRREVLKLKSDMGYLQEQLTEASSLLSSARGEW